MATKPGWTAIYMRAFPGPEWYLAQMIIRVFRLHDMRALCVFGCRVIYAMWWDERFKSILIRLAGEVRAIDFDDPQDRPTYQEME